MTTNLTTLDQWIKAAEAGADAKVLDKLVADMNSEPSWCERCKCHHYGRSTCSDPWPGEHQSFIVPPVLLGQGSFARAWPERGNGNA